MFRIIKITLNAFLLVLAIIGFNAIGGEKYVEMAKTQIGNFIQQRISNNTKSLGDFSNLHEEFQIDNTINVLGYKGLIAEHKVSGQKLCIIDSGEKSLLTKSDIQGNNIETQLQDLASKFKYQAISFKEIKVTSKGNLSIYGQTVPYAKFEAKSNRFPVSDLAGIVAVVQTSDGSNKIALAICDKKKYSQLITDEFFKNVKES
ncbi:MAG: hypothetical protein MJ237_00610 [bacterium]|nr:hypothetical protein [bacterium]